jgi:hypothetical protein
MSIRAFFLAGFVLLLCGPEPKKLLKSVPVADLDAIDV